MAKKEEEEKVIPELEIPVSKAWIRLVQFVRMNCPYGTIKVKIVNSNPTTLTEWKQDIRFDKETSVPQAFLDE
jgi:hypothetical protein